MWKTFLTKAFHVSGRSTGMLLQSFLAPRMNLFLPQLNWSGRLESKKGWGANFHSIIFKFRKKSYHRNAVL